MDNNAAVSIVLRLHSQTLDPLKEEAGYLQETYCCPWGG